MAQVGQQPMEATQQPMGTMQQPMGTMQQPMGTMQQPMGMAQQPMGTMQQPVGMTQQHIGMTQQTVVIQQPGMIPQPMGKLIGAVGGHRNWDSGLFSCFDDCQSMCLTLFCLECAIATIAIKTGECMCMPYCVPGALIALRARIRTLGGIQGSICSDCMVISCCGLCAVCQMQRELETMGL